MFCHASEADDAMVDWYQEQGYKWDDVTRTFSPLPGIMTMAVGDSYTPQYVCFYIKFHMSASGAEYTVASGDWSTQQSLKKYVQFPSFIDGQGEPILDSIGLSEVGFFSNSYVTLPEVVSSFYFYPKIAKTVIDTYPTDSDVLLKSSVFTQSYSGIFVYRDTLNAPSSKLFNFTYSVADRDGEMHFNFTDGSIDSRYPILRFIYFGQKTSYDSYQVFPAEWNDPQNIDTDYGGAYYFNLLPVFVKSIEHNYLPEIESKLGDIDSHIQDQTKQQAQQHEETKGLLGTVIDGIKNLPGKIWEVVETGLKKLFIPGDDFLSNKVKELSDKLLDSLGFLYYPFDWTFDLLSSFLDFNDNASMEISWPDITVKLPDQTFTIVSAGSFNFEDELVGSDDGKQLYTNLVDAVRLITSIILFACMLIQGANLVAGFFGLDPIIDPSVFASQGVMDALAAAAAEDIEADIEAEIQRQDMAEYRRNVRYVANKRREQRRINSGKYLSG